MENLFENATFVGREYAESATDACADKILEIEDRVQCLEQRLATSEINGSTVNRCEEKVSRKKVGWKRIKEVFTTVVKPILTFLPRILTAVTGLLAVKARLQGV